MPAMSELLKIREVLQDIDVSKHFEEDAKLTFALKKVTDSIGTAPKEMIDQLIKTIHTKQHMTVNITQDLYSRLDRDIKSLVGSYVKKSDEWCRTHGSYTDTEWLDFLDAIYQSEISFNTYVNSRVDAHSDWRKSAMIYHLDRPDRLEEFYSYYPIYVVDRWRENAKRIESKLHPAQSRKFRFYDTDSLNNFPKESIGFILARNHFSHCSKYRFKKDLTWAAAHLCVGGTLAFNFNNCEHSGSARLFEAEMRSFQLGKDVKSIIASLELEITRWEFLSNSSTTWVEIKRPGNFTSIKRTETLGKILEK